MNTRAILAQLHNERDRITRAIEVLESLDSTGHKAHRPQHRRRPMSKAARKRIAQAKRKWWAARKRQKQ